MGTSEDLPSPPSSATNDHFDPLPDDTLPAEKDLADSQTEETLKQSLIVNACRDRDIPALAKLADTKGGLLDDKFRQDAWPILLGCGEQSAASAAAVDVSWQDLPSHSDEGQVELDVNRAFVYYPNDQSERVLGARKEALSRLIRQTLRKHPMLCYFQGFHDIVQVMLLVLGESKAVAPIARLSLLRIRDYMLPSMAPAVRHLQLLPALLDVADRQLCQHLAHTNPYFALAATLTLYAHDVQDYRDIARLYDFLLAHEPVIAIYLFAAVIISRKRELLQIPPDEPNELHFALTKLPQPLDLEGLIEKSLDLFRQYPPTKLPYGAWRRISSYSVLKTSRDLGLGQSLERGETLFELHSKQLRREELLTQVATHLWKYRRPAGRMFPLVLVGALSIWLRWSGNDRVLLSGLWTLKEWVFSK